jgi:hypothetical protein
MTDDDFLERSRRRFNRLCSAIVLVRRDRSGQLQRETIGLVVIRNNSVGLSDLLFQSIIMMQSTEDRLRADSVTGGEQMPMAAGRNTRLDRFGCARA